MRITCVMGVSGNAACGNGCDGGQEDIYFQLSTGDQYLTLLISVTVSSDFFYGQRGQSLFKSTIYFYKHRRVVCKTKMVLDPFTLASECFTVDTWHGWFGWVL